MSVGEALIHGLLGGTIGASEHYVTDWKDRVKRARDKKALKEERTYLDTVRQQEWDQRDKEAKAERDFRKSERLAYQTYQTGERTAKQKYESEGMQFGYDEKTDRLFTIKPGEESFAPVVAEIKHGEFEYKGLGTTGKGLLNRFGGGSGSKSSNTYEDIKTPSSGPLGGESVTTIYIDPEGEKWEHVRDNAGNLIMQPLQLRTERPVVMTPEQLSAANQFADKTVEELAGWFSTDATDFADWGGSREAAKEYFRQNYLKGQHLNEQGRLRLPGSNPITTTTPTTNTTAQPPTTQNNDRTEAFTKMYGNLRPEQQDTLKQAIKAMQIDKRDPSMVKQRLLDYGFTPDQLSLIFD